MISLSFYLQNIQKARLFQQLIFGELLILSNSEKNQNSQFKSIKQQVESSYTTSLLLWLIKWTSSILAHFYKQFNLIFPHPPHQYFNNNNQRIIYRMQNKQLERQLKAIVQNLKGDQIQRITESLQKDHNIFLHKNFTKSGINCTCCTLTHQKFIATGFGRNQQEAFVNATKNFMETLIATNTFVAELRTSIRQRDGKLPVEIVTQRNKNAQKNDDTIILSQEKDLADMSDIEIERGGCNCVYFEVHQHHLSEIRNMQARMKLIMKENQMLKELLLKDVHKDHRNKENYGRKANVN